MKYDSSRYLDLFLSSYDPLDCFSLFIDERAENYIFCPKASGALKSPKRLIIASDWDELTNAVSEILDKYFDANIYADVCSRRPNENGAINVTSDYIGECRIIDVDIDRMPDFSLINYVITTKKQTAVSPFFVLFSGHGYHLYYRFDRPLDPKTYQRKARLFLQYFIHQNGRIKESIDKNSIVPGHRTRMPGTLNMKDKPIETKIINIKHEGDFEVDPEGL